MVSGYSDLFSAVLAFREYSTELPEDFDAAYDALVDLDTEDLAGVAAEIIDALGADLASRSTYR